MTPSNMRQVFKVGDRVRVTKSWDWVSHPVGTVRSRPREQDTLQGAEYTYYVVFDGPAYDTEGEGPFTAGVISSRDLEPF